MTKRTLLLQTLALAVVLVGATSARASLISWGYNWNASPGFVTAGTGKITLSNEPAHTGILGDSNTVATALQVFSTASPTSPDKFTPSGGNYSLTIQLTDTATSTTGSLTFTGQFQGSFSSSSANVTNTFTGPTTQWIDLGSTHFVVTIGPYTPPGPPDSSNLGSIGAFVHVGHREHINHAPEPSTMALAGIAVGLAGLAGWRRSRRKAAA
jgi:hypothetical protein